MGVCPEFTLSSNRPEIIESTASATNANPNTTAREEIAGNWKTLVVRFLGRAMEVVWEQVSSVHLQFCQLHGLCITLLFTTSNLPSCQTVLEACNPFKFHQHISGGSYHKHQTYNPWHKEEMVDYNKLSIITLHLTMHQNVHKPKHQKFPVLLERDVQHW